MGAGFGFTCKKCGNEYQAFLGSGMMYPSIYEEVMGEIQSGKYGAELQELSNTIPYVAVDAEDAVYYCRNCGIWEVSPNLSLYGPRDMEYIQREIEEFGHSPCPWKSTLRAHYRIIRRYYHKCGKCGRRMRQLSSHETSSLPCPKCGEKNEGSMFRWD